MPNDLASEFEALAPQDAANEFEALAPKAAPAPTMKVEPKSIRGTGSSDEQLGIQRGAEVGSQTGLQKGLVTGTVGEGKNTPPTSLPPYDQATNNNPLSGDPLARTIVAGILGMGAGAVVGAGAGALGAGSTLSSVASGAAGGATSSATAGGDPVKGAIFGGALSGLMAFAANRAAETVARSGANAARLANPVEREAILAQGKEQVGKVIQKYKLGDLKNPQVAKEATDFGVQQAQAEYETALDAVKQAPTGGPLYNSALARAREVEQELNTLKALRPTVNRLATDHEMRMTMVERLTKEPIPALRDTANAVVAAPFKAVGAALKPADIALAKLYQARIAGQPITPALIAEATGAGVDPQTLNNIFQAQPQPPQR